MSRFNGWIGIICGGILAVFTGIMISYVQDMLGWYGVGFGFIMAILIAWHGAMTLGDKVNNKGDKNVPNKD